MAAAIEQFITAAEQGQAVNRSGRTYRPSDLAHFDYGDEAETIPLGQPLL